MSGRDHPGTDATDLYVMNVDGTGVTRVTFQDGTVEYPSWDPHSRRIAFSTVFAAASGVYVVGFDGTEAASWTQPGLTTIEQPIADIATTAVEALKSLIDEPDRPLPGGSDGVLMRLESRNGRYPSCPA